MEEAKSFSLQSPERIAKLYGGNKQKILQALQSGALRQFAPAPMDQLLATAAANFIDEVRDAAQAEAVPQQTVFDKLFTPPQPQMPQGMPQAPMGAPAGLGATPEAAAMPAPAAAPPMGMPQEQAAPGMAMGGMVPPYASGGGLSDLPLPDDMFDENRNGGFNDGYRGGGLVAFAAGEKVVAQPSEYKDPNEIVVNAQKDEEDDKNLNPLMKRGVRFGSLPTGTGGVENTLGGNLTTLNQEVPYLTKYAQKLQAYYDRMLDPAEQKKRTDQDKYLAAAKGFFKMAQTPGSIFQAVSAGAEEALPGIEAAEKGRRADERAVYQALAGEERTGNKEVMDRAAVALDMLKQFNTLDEASQDRNFRNVWESLGRDAQIMVARISGMFGLAGSQVGARASMYGADRELLARRGAFFTNALADYTKDAALDPEYQKLFKVNPNAAKDYIYKKAEAATAGAFGGGGGNTLRFDSKGNLIP